jgi:hypothetical protein
VETNPNDQNTNVEDGRSQDLEGRRQKIGYQDIRVTGYQEKKRAGGRRQRAELIKLCQRDASDEIRPLKLALRPFGYAQGKICRRMQKHSYI